MTMLDKFLKNHDPEVAIASMICHGYTKALKDVLTYVEVGVDAKTISWLSLVTYIGDFLMGSAEEKALELSAELMKHVDQKI